MLKIVRSKLISRHHNDFFTGYFRVDKTRELINRKYYYPSLRKDVESYVKRCDIYLTSKAIRYKHYGDLQALLVLTYQ